LSLAEIYVGGTRENAARIGGVGLQVVHDWVLRFNADGPDGLLDRKRPGKSLILEQAHRQGLLAIVESGSLSAIHGVVRWRLVDLVQWLRDEFGLSVSRQTLGWELRALGYAKLSARPRHHTQDADAVATFKKTSPSCAADHCLANRRNSVTPSRRRRWEVVWQHRPLAARRGHVEDRIHDIAKRRRPRPPGLLALGHERLQHRPHSRSVISLA
jgi:transposase|tara:strand:+ start:3938 stop:4579 length:642 start_codon:yes stop_codon:yes gene_type:complete